MTGISPGRDTLPGTCATGNEAVEGEHAMTAARQRSMWVAGLSTVVEWYDFTLYLYFATVLSRVFFGGGEQALLVTLAGFAVSYLMRPLGALCFGHLGDRLAGAGCCWLRWR
jgi:MHS family proline/betaine transporter-like MFS transporter